MREVSIAHLGPRTERIGTLTTQSGTPLGTYMYVAMWFDAGTVIHQVHAFIGRKRYTGRVYGADRTVILKQRVEYGCD
jgi:hypothetical protein